MKLAIAVFSILGTYVVPSQAAELACWNLYARSGDRPAFTATVEANNYLSNVRMLVNSGPFGEFDISDVTTEAEGVEITAKRSPYKGGQSFQLTADSAIRIILPLSLDNETLRGSSFKAGNLPANLLERQNGVIEVEGSRHDSGGSIFIRMHCASKG